jgi:hypothetical protein
MHAYTAYGLEFESDIELPELLAAPSSEETACATGRSARVSVRLGRIEIRQSQRAAAPPVAWISRGDACLLYDGIAAYHITGGRSIVIDRAPGADDRVVRLFLLGPALALLLHQRGLLVLHASGVAIGGRAAVFVAEKGEGKSTLAAALHARGFPLVADDVVPVDLSDPARPIAYPGFPQLKLSPEAAVQMGDEPADLPRVHPDFQKRARRAASDFSTQPLPLSCVFVLETADRLAIEPLTPQQRFVELVRHSYLAQLLESTGEAADHFRMVVQLAQCTAVLRLQRRRELNTLSQVAQLVEMEMTRAPRV